ncbi:MAG: aldo/keto reductase [Pirellulaceae bacterium]
MPALLPTRPLGKTGLDVTQLGYGTMGLRGPKTWGVRVVEDDHADRILNSVLDSGINFLDTSPDYGVAEERVGRFVGHRRSEFYLATKCGCDYKQCAEHLEIDHRWEKEVVARNLETSLKRLQTDYVDLMQFHGGDARTLEENGLLDQLLDFKQQGLIRHIGVSSKLPNLAGLAAIEVFETFQIPYSCLASEHETLIGKMSPLAGVIIRGGIAHGGPDAEIQRSAVNDVWSAARLDEVLPAGMSRAELLLRMTLALPGCDTTIVGTCNEVHLQQNIEAAKQGALESKLVEEVRRRVAQAIE